MKVPIWQIIKIVIPVIRSIADNVEEYRKKESDGGKRITAHEWELLIFELLTDDLGPKLVDLLVGQK